MAITQALLGVAIATAPSTAGMPGNSFKDLLFTGLITALWLSATFFRVASNKDHQAAGSFGSKAQICKCPHSTHCRLPSKSE